MNTGYKERRESGIPWLGALPAHWKPAKLKYIADIINGATPDSGNDSYWDGDIVWITPSDLGKLTTAYVSDSKRRISEAGFKSCGTSMVAADTVIMTTRAPIGNSCITTVEACFNQGCKALVLRDGDNKFVYYQLVGYRLYLEMLGSGSTFMELSTDKFKDFVLPVPPLPEQRAIAAYLDHKTAQLDTLLAQKETLLRLLHQKRQALINEAVTQGLDPTSPRKPSGVAWLGDVPAHWEVRKLKWASTRITDGAHISPDRTSEDYPFVSTVDIKRGKIDFDNCLRTTAESYSYLVNTGCRPHLGDVLFSKDGTVGRTALIDFDKDFVVASSLIIITPNAVVINSEFMEFALQSIVSTNYVESLLSGSALRRISIAKVSNMPIVVPPLHEQEVILDSLKKRFAKIDNATDNIHTQIKTLKVYRQSLISEVVTGKVDVRTEAQALAGTTSSPSPTNQSSQPTPARPASVGQLKLF
jgi:type I restriction enzyme S subunit